MTMPTGEPAVEADLPIDPATEADHPVTDPQPDDDLEDDASKETGPDGPKTT